MKKLTLGLVLVLFAQFIWAQELLLKGKIIDQNTNQPISGALIKLSGSEKSTLSAIDGSFQIALSDAYETVVITADGYGTQKIFLAGQTTLDVGMKVSNTQQEESSGLSSDQLAAQSVVNLEQSVQGTSSGVFVQNSGGQLGQGPKVRIRGGSSLTGSNEPLYVVDGVPLTSGNQSDMDPSSIESMEILKDAAAIALYGSRAANGVVLIKTKKGDAGKLKVDMEYQFGVSQNQPDLDLMSREDYNILNFEYTLRNILNNPLLAAEGTTLRSTNLESFLTRENLESWYNDLLVLREASTDGFIDYEFPNGDEITLSTNNPIFRFDNNTNWQEEAFRTGISHRANLNISGGSEKNKVFANINYLNQEGILIGNDFERVGGRVNVSSSWTSKFSSNLSVGFAKTNDNKVNQDSDDGNPVQMILLPPGDAPDPDNNYILQVRSNEYNPQTEIFGSTYFETSDKLNSNLTLGYDFTQDLTLTVNGGVDFLNAREERRQGPATQAGTPTGFSRLTETQVFNYLVDATLNYNKAIGNNNLTALAGTSYQNSNAVIDFKSARINSISDLEKLPEDNPSLLNNPIPGSAFAFLSFFGSVGYEIDSKYSVQVNARMDGSSRFSPENRYGVFPALSAGWTISNEDFLQGNKAVSFLKLNASFGLLGNTPFDDFLYRTNYFIINYGNDNGLRVSNLGNPELKWETTQQIDASLDFGFLNDRISGSLGYFLKNTSDLLFPVPVSQTSGVGSVIQNNGELTNSGIEFSINTVNLSNSDLTWQTSFNITYNQNEITNIGGRPLVSGVSAFIEGEAPGVFYLPEFTGVSTLDGKAEYDNNGLPTTDYDFALSSARKVVGNPNPKFFGGLTNSLSYKDFDFSFMFQFVQGVDLYWETGEIIANSGYALFNQTKDQVDRWYTSGEEASYPALNPALESTNPSSRWVVDGSYIRLKTINLTYTLPSSITSNMNLGYVRIYISGQNLLTFTQYPGYDPDVSSSDPNGGAFAANINRGIDFFTAPQPRTILTGIKIGF